MGCGREAAAPQQVGTGAQTAGQARPELAQGLLVPCGGARYLHVTCTLPARYLHVTCSYLQLRVVVLALLACHSVTCEYASTTTCEYRFLQVSCHTLLALHLRQLHVALA